MVRDNRQHVGRLLMEVWVDQVLAGADPNSAAASVMKAHGAPLQVQNSSACVHVFCRIALMKVHIIEKARG